MNLTVNALIISKIVLLKNLNFFLEFGAEDQRPLFAIFVNHPYEIGTMNNCYP